MDEFLEYFNRESKKVIDLNFYKDKASGKYTIEVKAQDKLVILEILEKLANYINLIK